MTSLQVSTEQVHEVISLNDATIIGILTAVVIALGFTVIYLFKHLQTKEKEWKKEIDEMYKQFENKYEELHKERISESARFNDTLLKINQQYYEIYLKLK